MIKAPMRQAEVEEFHSFPSSTPIGNDGRKDLRKGEEYVLPKDAL